MRKKLIKLFLRTPMGRPIRKKFTAGETIEEGISKAKELHNQGFKITLAYAGGEHLDNFFDIERTIRMHKLILGEVSELSFPCDVAIKFSEFGLFSEISQDCFEYYFPWFTYLLKEANEGKIFVWVDAEELEFREKTLQIISQIPQDYYKNLGLCIQAYAKDSAFFIKRVVDLGLSVRICNGAYKEDSERIFTAKDQLQLSFYHLLFAAGIANLPRIQVATHNEYLRWMAQNMHPLVRQFYKEKAELGSLLGRHKEAGENVYVLFGPDVEDFLARRFMEYPWKCFLTLFKAVFKK